MHPVLLHIGNFELASYGLMTALGYVAATSYLLPRLKTCGIKGLTKDIFWNLIFIIFVGAIVGGKLLFILVSWSQLGPTLAEKLSYIVHNLRYGFVFFGGMLVAVGALIAYIRYKKLPLLKTSDFLIVGLPLGHALGRIGCFLAGCCYGKPTTLPWGVTFTDPHALVAPELIGVPLHPTQLYEAILNFALFLLLHYASKKPHKDGKILVEYVWCYALMRFGIEFLRGDFRGGFLLGMSPSQLICLAIAGVAFYVWAKFLRNEHAN
ncbi:MAG: prolipoprotein diacylglyceryl transferase [Elusimicrobiaceae bacterium]|nr:prolipoprotein diacylglyceryl transferase [Elusimicrobiaceae bacterium]MBP5616301.1 prolipoprotein diacylglyceryl transferase [Elusimicrobiaceae bacterium]